MEVQVYHDHTNYAGILLLKKESVLSVRRDQIGYPYGLKRRQEMRDAAISERKDEDQDELD